MKNKLILAIVLVLCVVNIGLIFYLVSDKNTVPDIVSNSCDADRFKNEYESLNGKDNGYGGKHLEISISSDNNVEYADSIRVKQLLTNGTGVIYFGFPECPWCRNMIPTLIDISKEYNKPVYYLNNRSERDTITLSEDGKLITEKEGSKDYYEILELIGEFASEYSGLEDNSIKRLYFPTVIFVKDGEIIGFHEGTVDSQEDASVMMNVEQQKELKQILRGYFNKLYSQKCAMEDSAC